MITVKVVTEGGDSWITGINATIEGACAYYMGERFNVGAYPIERLECVVSVELID